jgi:hypothetical protein
MKLMGEKRISTYPILIVDSVMPRTSVFQWIEGSGLLVLAPGQRGSSDLRAEAINRAASDGALVCALVNGVDADADALLDDLEQLGAPTGYIVDLVTEDDDTIEAQLRDAGIIVIESGSDIQTARSSLIGAAQRGIRAAYEHGAVVLAEGLSALLLGQWVMREDHVVIEGLGWVTESVIVPTTVQLSELVKPLLVQHPHAYAVGIGLNTALALGPGAQVSVWGSGQIGVSLGTDYGHSV